MSKILKNNNIYFIIFVITFIIMLVTVLNDTNIFYVVKNFIFDKNYRDNFTLAESSIAYDITLFQVINKVLGNYDWNFDTMIIWGTNIFQIIIPLFGAIGSLLFFHRKMTIYQLSLYRSKGYLKFLLKEILSECLKITISVFFAYVCFYVICLFVSKGSYNITVTRSFLLDFFGNSFYKEHRELYYLLVGFLKFFVINFIYILFSISICLHTRNSKVAFLLPLVWYYSLTLIASILTNGVSFQFIYLSPALIMMSEYYNNIISLCVFVLPLIILIISIFLIKQEAKYVAL